MRKLLVIVLLGCSGSGVPPGGSDLATRADLGSGRGAVGSACTASSECERNCLRDPAWPNGYCTTVQLDCRVAVDCPTGTICGEVNPPGNEICLKRCNVDGDCRTSEGYACCLHGAGAEVCVPLRFCR